MAMTATWVPKEMMSEDSHVSLAASRLAQLLFDPAPKTTEGVAAMVEVLRPKLCQLFGTQKSSALLLIWDEEFLVSGLEPDFHFSIQLGLVWHSNPN